MHSQSGIVQGSCYFQLKVKILPARDTWGQLQAISHQTWAWDLGPATNDQRHPDMFRINVFTADIIDDEPNDHNDDLCV